MNEFYTRIMQTSDKDTKRYEITFSTNNRRYFDRVEEACRECIDEPTIKEVPLDKVVLKDIDDETFDIVDAFMHLIWGLKVRMTHWDKDEYIRLVNDCGDEYLVNDKDEFYPAETLFSLIDGKWEIFKEEK